MALFTSGAEVTCTRNPDRAAEVSRLVNRNQQAGRCRGSWDLLVNATPLSVSGGRSLSVSCDAFDGRIAYDLVYNRRRRSFSRMPRPRAARPSAGSTCW